MQCMSAVFAAAKCLSVRPSVTTRYYVKATYFSIAYELSSLTPTVAVWVQL